MLGLIRGWERATVVSKLIFLFWSFCSSTTSKLELCLLNSVINYRFEKVECLYICSLGQEPLYRYEKANNIMYMYEDCVSCAVTNFDSSFCKAPESESESM